MIKKKQIVIFHCGFIYTGGGERIVLEEIKEFKKRGYEVTCYVPNFDPDLSYPDIIKSYDIRTFLPQLPKEIPLRFAIQMVLSCILAPLFIFKFKDVDFFIGANQPGAYIAWIISGILKKPYFVYLSQPNRVLYPRDNEDWQNVKDYYFLDKLINKIFRAPIVWLDKKSITGGENLFINGSFVAKEIIKIYKPKVWVDCPGGAHPLNINAIKTNRYEGKIKVNGHSPQKPYILYTSRHEPWKRFDWAIEVVSDVIEKYPDVRLVIPGAKTTVTKKLAKLAMDLGISDRVIITGPITQKALWKLYENAAVYIFTSPKEDLGIVVEEAEAAGVPVVAWKAGGPTVTVKDTFTGYLCKPYDKKEMAKKIVYLLENPKVRQQMSINAWQHIKDNFTWKKHVDIIESEIKKVVADKSIC